MPMGRGHRFAAAATLALASLGVVPASPASAAPPDARHGTAFALASSGFLVTAASTVEGKGDLTVTLGGRQVRGQVLETDDRTGLALLYVARTGLPSARLGSYEAERRDQVVYVYGIAASPEDAVAEVRTGWGGLAAEDAPPRAVFERPIPDGFAGAAVVNVIGQVVGLLGPATAGEDPPKSAPIVGTRALWGLVRGLPTPDETIPGAPMEPGSGVDGVRRLYDGGVARVRFEPAGTTDKRREPAKPGVPAKEGGPTKVPATPPPGATPIGVPSGGLDLVEVDDGRVLRCRVSAKDPKTGALTLEFDGVPLVVPAARVKQVLWFRDFDPAARNDDERAKIAKGLERWKGGWVSATRWKELRDAAEAANSERLRLARRPWGERGILETEKFRIESNLPDDRIRLFARLLEEHRRHLSAFLPKGTLYDRVPVLIFRERAEFEAFAARDIGRPGEHTVGYFTERGRVLEEEHLVLFDMPGGGDETLRVLLHEATHLFVNTANDFWKPIWLDEGLAEYFGGSVWRSGAFKEGGVQDERLLWIQDLIARDALKPLGELVAGVGVDERERVRARFGLDEYAYSWAFVHFLLHGRNGTYRGAFRNYVVSSLTPFTWSNFDAYDSLLRVVQRDDFVKIQDELEEHVARLPFGSGVAYAKRAEARLDRKEEGAAIDADLRSALRVGGGDAETLRRVARVLRRLAGRFSEATDLLRKAVELDPLDLDARRDLAESVGADEEAVQRRLCDALAGDR